MVVDEIMFDVTDGQVIRLRKLPKQPHKLVSWPLTCPTSQTSSPSGCSPYLTRAANSAAVHVVRHQGRLD